MSTPPFSDWISSRWSHGSLQKSQAIYLVQTDLVHGVPNPPLSGNMGKCMCTCMAIYREVHMAYYSLERVGISDQLGLLFCHTEERQLRQLIIQQPPFLQKSCMGIYIHMTCIYPPSGTVEEFSLSKSSKSFQSS